MKSTWPLALLLPMLAVMALAPAPDSVNPGPAMARLAQDCPLPAELAAHGSGLGQVAAALADQRDLEVLAIGSTSMLGPAGVARDGFTYRAIDTLAASRPGAKVAMTARNARGALAADMLAKLRTELGTHQYPLVLWQAGSVDALHAVPVPEFRQTLAEGAKLVAEARGSLILIDTQFSRLMQSKVDVAPYEDVMREVASNTGVALFPRYDLTREWVMSGLIDLEHTTQTDRQKTADRLNECLGQALANAIGGDLTSPRP